jgi:hypothetical protein
MPKHSTDYEKAVEAFAQVEPELIASSEPAAEPVFDFRVHRALMTPEVENAYNRLERIAIIRGDRSLLPAGKVMTRAEIETALGSEIGTMRQGPCC